MRLKIIVFTLGLGLLMLVGAGVTPPAAVQAELLLQDMPRLDGFNIYFTESQNEPSRFDRGDDGISRLAGLLQQQGANLFTLEWRTGFPDDADLIIIAGPDGDFSAQQTARLWAYIRNGGRVLLVTLTEGRSNGGPIGQNSGLFQLMWGEYGLRVRDDVVVIERDRLGADDAVATTAEPEPTTRLISELIVPPDNFTGDHPILATIADPLVFFGTRSIEFDASPQLPTVTPLVFTTEMFYGEARFQESVENNTVEFNIGQDTARGPLALAAALVDDRTNTRVVLLGDRDMLQNGRGFQTAPPNTAAFVFPGNVRFILNAVSWLLDAEPVTVDFPTPGPTATATITPTLRPTATPQPTEAEGSGG